VQRIFRLWCIGLGLGLTLGAHAQNQPPPATPITEEVLVEAAEPRYAAPTLRDRIGRIWAPVLINGKGPFRLVLDTGATTSAIIDSVARRLELKTDASQMVDLNGATGAMQAPYVKVDSLQVGDLALTGTNLPILPAVFGGAEGVLGTNGLSDKRILIDFRRDIIDIRYSRSQPPPVGFITIPFTIVRGRLVSFDIQIGGIRTHAILDTGAQLSVGNNSLREALERRGKPATDVEIIGVTLAVEHGESLPTPTIHMGGASLQNLRITFGDMFIFEQWGLIQRPTLLLGMDVIGLMEIVIIDYKRKQLYFRVRS